jgi:hypothetical protein
MPLASSLLSLRALAKQSSTMLEPVTDFELTLNWIASLTLAMTAALALAVRQELR